MYRNETLQVDKNAYKCREISNSYTNPSVFSFPFSSFLWTSSPPKGSNLNQMGCHSFHRAENSWSAAHCCYSTLNLSGSERHLTSHITGRSSSYILLSTVHVKVRLFYNPLCWYERNGNFTSFNSDIRKDHVNFFFFFLLWLKIFPL